MQARSYEELSSEQQVFIDTAMTGKNILVDACIGSGKTTAIQALCNHMDDKILSRTGLRPNVLYLTYNRLLKVDAQAKILNNMTQVTNYHGFAFSKLMQAGFSKREIGVSDSIQLFNRYWDRTYPFCRNYDVLVLDEYQDIDQEIAELLSRLSAANPLAQRIAVGDMCQKIYDKTCLDVPLFMSSFLGDATNLEFTQCFRLSSEIAANIGRVWGKKIVGVNDACQVDIMSFDDAFAFLAKQNPGDILCLGANKGPRANMQNKLESRYPERFNKNSLWSKISEGDSDARNYDDDSAIFTTYDGCKGMERPICVVFDWDLSYWNLRLGMPGANYEILRNVFLVAASRGKSRIIFVKSEERKSRRPKYDWGFTRPKAMKPDKSMMLTWDDLAKPSASSGKFEDMSISSMFDFKYIEHVEDAYKKLLIKKLDRPESEITIQNFDGLIDLSPCIGLYQEVVYFENTSIDNYIQEFFATHPRVARPRNLDISTLSLDQKILYLSSLELNQARYFSQVETPFVSEFQYRQIKSRLSEELPTEAITQKRCQIVFEDKSGNRLFSAVGMCDVMMPSCLYELKFVSALQHTHFLQTAMYMVGHGYELGRLWNVKNNAMYEIQIPDKQAFLNSVARAVTKNKIRTYYGKILDGDAVGQVGAFDYYNRVWEFCEANFMTCEELETRMISGEFFNASQIEAFFDSKGLNLPVPGDLYLRYWKQCAELIRTSLGV